MARSGPGAATIARVASRRGGGADLREALGAAAQDGVARAGLGAAAPPSLPLSKRGGHTRCCGGRQAWETTDSGTGICCIFEGMPQKKKYFLQLLLPAPGWWPFMMAAGACASYSVGRQPGCARHRACLPLCGCGLLPAPLTLCGSAFCRSALSGVFSIWF